MYKAILFLMLNSLLTAGLIAQQFKVVQNFPNNYSFNLKENAHQLSDGSSRKQATAIWNNNAVHGFENIDLNFNFLVEAEYYLGYKDLEGADGIAFVLQSAGDNALGSMGVGMGFAANPDDRNKKVAPSLGVEMDSHYNKVSLPLPIDDNPEDHFSYLINGELMQKVGLEINAKEDSDGNPLNIEDSTFHCVKFFWNSTTKELSSYLDGQLRKKETFDGVNEETLTNILKTNLVYWGFTTGTANLDNVHMVRFDGITRDNQACFVEIYKESAYDITNPNCGLEEISLCNENQVRNIKLGISTAQMKVDRIEWVSQNNKTIITPLNSEQDKANLQMNDQDIIEVIVFYSNGCIAKDEFVVNSKEIEIVNKSDTLVLCEMDDFEIDLDLIIDGKRVDNTDEVKWSWTNREFIVNKGDLKDKEQISLKDRTSDTITFVVTAEFTDDQINKCTDITTVTVIVNSYYFDEKISYSACRDTAFIEFEVYEDAALTIPLATDKIELLNWVSPNSNDDFLNGIIPNEMLATVVAEGKYEISLKLRNGCTISSSIIVDLSPNNLDLVPNKIEICRNDSVTVTSEVDATKYIWSTGENTKSITISEQGLYTLEIETSLGCRFIDTLEVAILPEIEFSIVGDSIICTNVGLVTLTSDKVFNTYLWSNGSTTNYIEVYSPGNYWLEVTDNKGCKARDEFTVKSSNTNINQDITYPDTIHIGKVYYNNNIVFNIDLTNNTSEPIKLTSNFNDSLSAFELINTKAVEFSFKPNELGSYNNRIGFIVDEPCSDTFYVYLVGSVYTKVVLELPMITTYPGVQTSIPIKLRSNTNIEDRYNFDLNFDNEIIHFANTLPPMNFSKVWNLNAGERVIENPTGTILLTNLDKRPLTVDTLYWENKYIESEVINGWVKLDSFCVHEYRLIEINYDRIIANYNIESDRLVIQKVGSNEESIIDINITNISSKNVLTKSTSITGIIELDLSGLASGVYFVEVKLNGLSNQYKFIKVN